MLILLKYCKLKEFGMIYKLSKDDWISDLEIDCISDSAAITRAIEGGFSKVFRFCGHSDSREPIFDLITEFEELGHVE